MKRNIQVEHAYSTWSSRGISKLNSNTQVERTNPKIEFITSSWILVLKLKLNRIIQVEATYWSWAWIFKLNALPVPSKWNTPLEVKHAHSSGNVFSWKYHRVEKTLEVGRVKAKVVNKKTRFAKWGDLYLWYPYPCLFFFCSLFDTVAKSTSRSKLILGVTYVVMTSILLFKPLGSGLHRIPT